MPLSEISTERLLTWKENVLVVRKEYEEGTHEGSMNSCRHCQEAIIVNTTRKSTCGYCIWKYMLLHLGMLHVDCKEFCLEYTYSPLASCNKRHDKNEHITRCNLWLSIINKELKSRS